MPWAVLCTLRGMLLVIYNGCLPIRSAKGSIVPGVDENERCPADSSRRFYYLLIAFNHDRCK
jgi:hypothetical protein